MRSRKKAVFLMGVLILLAGLACGGCGSGKTDSGKLEGSLQDIMTSLYANAELDADFKEGLDSFEMVDLTDDIEVSILGTDEITYTEGVASVPMISSMAYQCVLLRVDEADVENAKQVLKDNANLDKWVCVSAETMLIESRGDVIFFIMSDKDTAAAMSSAFQKL